MRADSPSPYVAPTEPRAFFWITIAIKILLLTERVPTGTASRTRHLTRGSRITEFHSGADTVSPTRPTGIRSFARDAHAKKRSEKDRGKVPV
jgi:hypothetical protein